jgi:F0F1-type ATP synthase assembly protein I
MTKKQLYINSNWKTDTQILRAFSLIGQLGLIMIVSILVFVLLGFYLDKLLGFKGLFIGILSLFGIFCGSFVVYNLLKKIFKKNI